MTALMRLEQLIHVLLLSFRASTEPTAQTHERRTPRLDFSEDGGFLGDVCSLMQSGSGCVGMVPGSPRSG
jgi:hypothetical protein